MSIENEIFKKSSVIFDKLEDFGFSLKGDNYCFETLFMSDSFKAIIKIDKNGMLTGEVIDIENNEIYYPLRVKNPAGSYVERVKAEYEQILNTIKHECFKERLFIFPQSNRIADYIKKEFGDSPLFLWDTAPGFGVFKNPDTEKWYGLIMNINRSKLDKTSSEEVEVINLKLDEELICELHKTKGFYPAWHMNKKSWITLTLDETLPDKEIHKYIRMSHEYTESKKKKR